MTLKRILVPVDFSEQSLRALDYAVELGKPSNAALSVVFAVEPLYYSAGDMGLLLEEQQSFGREQLARLEIDLKKQRVKCHTVLRTGTPYKVIIDEAAKGKADLIVMATHGRTGLSHLVMGSVADKVVRCAACPVLTIRPNRKRRKARVTAD